MQTRACCSGAKCRVVLTLGSPAASAQGLAPIVLVWTLPSGQPKAELPMVEAQAKQVRGHTQRTGVTPPDLTCPCSVYGSVLCHRVWTLSVPSGWVHRIGHLGLSLCCSEPRFPHAGSGAFAHRVSLHFGKMGSSSPRTTQLSSPTSFQSIGATVRVSTPKARAAVKDSGRPSPALARLWSFFVLPRGPWH